MDIINPPGLAPPRGYSHGVLAEGRLLFVAGQIGWNATHELVSDRFVDQFDQALANVLAVVLEAGGLAGLDRAADDLRGGQVGVSRRRSAKSASATARAWAGTIPR